MPNLIKNKLGGIEDHDKDALERAKKVDLITFPGNIGGTNCFNCQWIKDKISSIGYCSQPTVKQYVNGQMCCNKWAQPGTLRAWE